MPSSTPAPRPTSCACAREDGVRVEVADRYPEREIPIQGTGRSLGSPDRENGRGLLLCAALASRWGVEYTPTHKQVWFQLDLPQRPVGTRSAGPVLPTTLLPVADERVRVAVAQIDRGGADLRLERGRRAPLRLRRRAGHRQAAHRLRRLAAHPRHRHRHRRGPPALPLGGQLRHPRHRRPRHPRLRLPPSGTRHERRTVHRLPARTRRRARRPPDPVSAPP